MPQFDNREDLMAALAAAQLGRERIAILYDGDNRSLALNSGANVTLYSGSVCEGTTQEERLTDIRLALLERRNARTGNPDGIGALGGLSERTTDSELAEKGPDTLAPEKDDIVPGPDERYVLTRDIDVIRANTVRRELAEELADLGLSGAVSLPAEGLTLVPFGPVRDDNFILNIWNGHTPPPEKVYAVTPYCHTLALEEKDFDTLIEKSRDAAAGGEARGLMEMPLFEALQRYGKQGGAVTAAESVFDLEYNYRYPHEWLTSWALAAQALDHDPNAMAELAAEAQNAIFANGQHHQLNFIYAAARMDVSLERLDEAFGLEKGTVARMQSAAQSLYDARTGTRPGGPAPRI